ncbi:hypothetical protein FB388_4073 [Pseudonocardia cypriaca]|uniref:Uncharacterized protein n=1 Tax=Pseudonocardia cypriaca TaxID=882449 RepID=A0A543FSS6_9PSEU|nr:hypothetical protein FB388_4073 [Pseudonocardia cypriaca]
MGGIEVGQRAIGVDAMGSGRTRVEVRGSR